MFEALSLRKCGESYGPAVDTGDLIVLTNLFIAVVGSIQFCGWNYHF